LADMLWGGLELAVKGPDLGEDSLGKQSRRKSIVQPFRIFYSLAQDRDIKLVHQLTSLAGVATTEGREIPKAHMCHTLSEPYAPARCNTAATSCGLA
jgi:hypothetical protein